MAESTKCQTPDAEYYTHINTKQIRVIVDFGRGLNLNEEEARLLEANVHNALELVLARYYPQGNITQKTKPPDS